VKRELLARIRSDGFDPAVAIDDRQRVVQMWRREGLVCAQVAEGNFENHTRGPKLAARTQAAASFVPMRGLGEEERSGRAPTMRSIPLSCWA
jgi:hypothetical protein